MVENVDVVILCGGRGTRLGGLTQATPKPLLHVGGKPFLQHLLENLQAQGFRRFVLSVGYLSEQFDGFVKAMPNFNIVLIREDEPLGTGGALRLAVEAVKTPTFIALNGDSFVKQELSGLIEYHKNKQSAFTTLAVPQEKVVGGAVNKGGLQISNDGIIEGFGGHSRSVEEWVNGGIYAVELEAVLKWPRGRYDLEKILLEYIQRDCLYAFKTQSQLLDIGTPACYETACQTQCTVL